MAVEAGWLWFWRVKPKKKANAEMLCQALSDSKQPPELEDLPIDDVLGALKKQYRSFRVNAKLAAGGVDIPKEQTAIEARWNRKHFAFTFYGDAWKQMDRVVELMTKRGLPSYDSGERKMHTLKNPPRFTGTPEEEILAEWEKVMMEESAKIERSTKNKLEQLKRKKAFVDSGGMERAREEAVRRVSAKRMK